MDHSIFRAVNKGTMGQIVVEGEKNPNIYSGKLKDEAFKEANPQKPQPVPYEIDSHKGIDLSLIHISYCYQLVLLQLNLSYMHTHW